jgi:hypothetical protein
MTNDRGVVAREASAYGGQATLPNTAAVREQVRNSLLSLCHMFMIEDSGSAIHVADHDSAKADGHANGAEAGGDEGLCVANDAALEEELSRFSAS